MNINIKVDESFVVNVLEEFCTTHICPKECIFDKIGICTEINPFNEALNRYNRYIKEEKE